LVAGLLAVPGARAGLFEAASRSGSRQLFQAAAPAPSILGVNGTFEPSQPGFYAARQQAIKDAFKVNQTFFANINSTVVPAIQKITNGTFEVKPVVAAGGGRIESANTDGKSCNGLRTRSQQERTYVCK